MQYTSNKNNFSQLYIFDVCYVILINFNMIDMDWAASEKPFQKRCA